MIIQADSLKWITEQPDASFAGVITDPPETISGDVIPELLRVSAGPVLVLAPLVWVGEEFPRSMRLPVRPESCLRWWCERDGRIAWGPVYGWRIAGEWTETTYQYGAFALDGFLGAKPIDLFKRLALLIGGGPILDPFAGSGPLRAACKLLGWESVSVDSDPACCEYVGRL